MTRPASPGVTAIIPARGGSKGLPRKNVLPLLGKPLIAHTIEAALAARHVDRVAVSTDDPEIASHPANCLMARIGKHVSPEVVAHFDALRLRRRFMYD